MTVVAREPGTARGRIGGGVTALGGATIVAGSFSDWVRADISGRGIREGTGWRNVYGHLAHGPWFAALGAVVVVIGATYVVGLVPRFARWLGVLAAVAAGGLAAYEIHDITTKVAGVTTKLEPGLPIVIAGAVIAILGCLLTVGDRPVSSRPRATPGPDAVPRGSPDATGGRLDDRRAGQRRRRCHLPWAPCRLRIPPC